MTFAEVRRIWLFDGLSDDELRGMLAASEEVPFASGDVIFVEAQPAASWWILLAGRVELVRQVGREEAVLGAMDSVGQWAGGFVAWDPAGTYLASGRAAGDGRVLQVPAAALRALLDGIPLVRHLVDGIFHTARSIEASTRARASLVTLGTLSAGLAHELNNPAAAATRAVDALQGSMSAVMAALGRLATANISADQYLALDVLRREARPPQTVVDPLAVADREEALADWMTRHGVRGEWELAPALAAADFDPTWCDRVLELVGPDVVEPSLAWVVASATSVVLLGEVKESTGRISALVASVKSYTQMDRGSRQTTDVTEGLESTLTMLGHKLRGGVAVVREYADPVPLVDAYPGELNQVWTNLVDNAVDAMDGAGTLRISVRADDPGVVVDIADTGTGMPADVVAHAFEAFFTTKDVGKGTGLGLDIARRIVEERHGGSIGIETGPAGTTIRVALPTHMAK